MIRKDLRSSKEARALSAELGVLSDYDGSCMLSNGNTKVIASVTGPRQSKYIRFEQYNKATIVIEIDSSGNQDSSLYLKSCMQYISTILSSCIDVNRYPRMVIVFTINILLNEGGVLSTALNACSLAALDAGLPMHYVPSVVTIASCIDVNSSGEKLLMVDPTLVEETDSDRCGVFVITVRSSRIDNNDVGRSKETTIISSDCRGKFSSDDLMSAISAAREAGDNMYLSMRKLLAHKYQL